MELKDFIDGDLMQSLESLGLDSSLVDLGGLMVSSIEHQLQPMMEEANWKHLAEYKHAKDPVEHLKRLPCGVQNFDSWYESQLDLMLPILTQFIEKPDATPSSEYLVALDQGKVEDIDETHFDDPEEARLFLPMTPMLKCLAENDLNPANQAIAAASAGLVDAARSLIKQLLLGAFDDPEFQQALKSAQKSALLSESARRAAQKGTDQQWSAARGFRGWVLERYHTGTYRNRADAARKLFAEAKEEAQKKWPNAYRDDDQFYDKLYRWLSDSDRAKR